MGSSPSLSVPTFSFAKGLEQREEETSGRWEEELGDETAARASSSSQCLMWAEREHPSGTFDQGGD